MISKHLLNLSLSDFFEKVVIWSPEKATDEAKVLENALPEISLTYSLSQANLAQFWIARQRCTSAAHVPNSVREVFQRIDRAMMRSLPCPAPVQRHWERIFGPEKRGKTLLGKWLQFLEKMELPCSGFCLMNVLGQDWLGQKKSTKHESLAAHSPREIIAYLEELARVMEKSGLYISRIATPLSEYWNLFPLAPMEDESIVPAEAFRKVTTVIQDVQEKIRNLPVGKHLFIPAGSVENVKRGFLSNLFVVQITCTGNALYRLRLLTKDQNDWFNAGKDFWHSDPAVQWSNVPSEILCKDDLWYVLIEPLVAPSAISEDSPSYGMQYLLGAVKRILERNVDAYQDARVDDIARNFDFRKVEYFDGQFCEMIRHGIEEQDLIKEQDLEGPEVLKTAFYAAPSGLSKTKKARYPTGASVVDVLALAVLEGEGYVGYKLYKIERSLLMLVHLFIALKQNHIPLHQREACLEIAKKTELKLTDALAKLWEDPSLQPEQRESLEMLIATFLDWTVRMENLTSSYDLMELTPLRSLYPIANIPHTILTAQSINALLSARSDASKRLLQAEKGILLNPMPEVVFPLNNESFQQIVIAMQERRMLSELLRLQLRPHEWMVWVHENIVKPFPLPTQQAPWSFALKGSSKQVRDLMEVFYAMGDSLLNKCQEEKQIFPSVIADLAHLYRVQFELMQQIFPEARECEVSWECFFRLLHHRGFDRLTKELDDRFQELEESFDRCSPLGSQRGPVGKKRIFPLFDHTWKELSKEEYPKELFHDFVLHRHLGIDLNPFVIAVSQNLQRMRRWMAKQLQVPLEEIEILSPASRDPRTEAYMLTNQSAQILQIACLTKPEISGINQSITYHNGPRDKTAVEPFYMSTFINHRLNGGSKMVRDGRVAVQHKVFFPKEGSIYWDSAKALRYQEVSKSRTQAEVIKQLLLEKQNQTAYELLMAASGSSHLNMDYLLAHFESAARLSSLFDSEAQKFFFSVMHMSNTFRKWLKAEPQSVKRLFSFLQRCMRADKDKLDEAIHRTRMLWAAELCYYTIDLVGMDNFFIPIISEIKTVLQTLMQKGSASECSRAAMLFLLMRNQNQVIHGINENKEEITPEIVRAVFLFGRHQSMEPQYANLHLLTQGMIQKIAKAMAKMMENPQQRQIYLELLLGKEAAERYVNFSFETIDLPLQDLYASMNKYIDFQEKGSWLQKYRKELFSSGFVNKGRLNRWEIKGTKKLLTEIEDEFSKIEESVQQKRNEISKKIGQFGIYQSYPLTLLRDENQTIEIDWERGMIWRDGYADVQGVLPPETQQCLDLEPLGKLRKESMLLDASKRRYTPLKEKYMALSFTAYPHNAYLQKDGVEYQLLSKKEGRCIEFPEALEEGFSVWRSFEKARDPSKSFLMCAHEEGGCPIPAYWIDAKGQIRPLDNKELRLADDSRPYSEATPFTRLGFRPENLLVWLDKEGNVQRVDLPISFENERLTCFEKNGEGKWQLHDNRLILQPQKEGRFEFLGEPLMLLLRDGEKQFLCFSMVQVKTWKERYYNSERLPKWADIWSRRTNEQVILIPFDKKKGLMPQGSLQNLFVAYLNLVFADYPNAAERLRRWAQPIGRPYTEEELRLIMWIVNSYTEKKDAHADASTIRLLALQRMYHHLQEYPLALNNLPEDLQQFVELWKQRRRKHSPKTTTRNRFINRAFEQIMRGTRPNLHCRIENLLRPYEQEEIARLLYDPGKESDTLIALRSRLDPEFDVKENQKLYLNANLLEQEYWQEQRMWSSIKDDYKLIIEPAASEILQSNEKDRIPFDQLQFKTVPHSPCPLFHRAYTLLTIKGEGGEGDEHAALCAYLDDWREIRKHFVIDSDQFPSEKESFFNNTTFRHIALWELLRGIRSLAASDPSIVWPEFPIAKKNEYEISSTPGEDQCKVFDEFIKSILKILQWESLTEEIANYNKSMAEARTQLFVENLWTQEGQEWAVDRLKQDIPYSLQNALEKWRHLEESGEHEDANRLDLGNAVRDLEDLPLFPENCSDQLILVVLQKRLKAIAEKNVAVQTELLDSANKLPKEEQKQVSTALRQMGRHPAVTIDECIGLSLDGTAERWKERCPYANAAEAQKLVGRYLVLKTEEQHLHLWIAQLEKCMQSDATFDDKQLEHQMRLAKRAYSPCTENIALLVHEYYADQRLRPDQKELIDLMRAPSSDSKVNGHVVQLIMGAGKTKVLAPILSLLNATPGQISLFVVPSSLYGTVKEDFANMLWDRFHRKVDVLTFDREQCDFESLIRLAGKLRAAQEEGIVLITRQRDLHALQLMLKERHELIRQMQENLILQIQAWARGYIGTEEQALRWANAIWEGSAIENPESLPKSASEELSRWRSAAEKQKKLSQEFSREIDLLQPILRVLSVKGYMLFDEFATLFDQRTQLSFPVGLEKKVNRAAVSCACRLYYEWLTRLEKNIGLEKNEQSYCKGSSLESVQKQIAEMAWDTYKENLESIVSKEVFLAYVLSDVEKHYDQQIEFYRHLCEWNGGTNLICKELCQEIPFLKYTLSFGLEGVFKATAFVDYGRSNKIPHLEIVIPWEKRTPKEGTLFKKYCETLLKTCQFYRLGQAWQYPEQVGDLLRGVLAEIRRYPLSTLGEAVRSLFGQEIRLEALNSPDTLKNCTEALQNALVGQEARKKEAALNLIRFYLENQMLPSQVKMDAVQLTSTPCDLGNVGARTDGFGGTWSYSQTWPMNVKKHPKTCIGEQIEEVLHEKQNQKVQKIDTSSCFAIVQQIQKLSTENMSAIIDVGAQFKVENNEEVARKLLNAFPKRKGILFYQQDHEGISALALLTKQGVELLPGSDKDHIRAHLQHLDISNPITYYDQAHTIGADIAQPQGSFAFVLLSDKVTWDDLQQGVMRERGLLDRTQSLFFLVPNRMEVNCDTNAVIQYTKSYQKEREAPVNFHGICDQLRAVLRSFMDREMRTCVDQTERQKMYNKWHAYLVEKQEDDLLLEFGAPRKKMRGWDALSQLLEELPVQLLGDKANKVKKEAENLLQWHRENATSIPEWVWEKEDFMGAAQEVNLSRDRQVMQEEENERMLASRVQHPEIPWRTLDATKVVKSPMGMAGDENMPALYALNDALKDRNFFPAFDEDLLISQNLLVTFKGQSNSLVTGNQKPIHHILVIKMEEDFRIVLISEQEAESLKIFLNRNPVENCWIVEPNGALCKNGSLKTPWENPFLSENRKQSQEVLSRKLAQIAWFQGDVLHMVDEEFKMKNALHSWLREKPELYKIKKELLEEVLNFRNDDAAFYRQNKELLL